MIHQTVNNHLSLHYNSEVIITFPFQSLLILDILYSCRLTDKQFKVRICVNKTYMYYQRNNTIRVLQAEYA